MTGGIASELAAAGFDDAVEVGRGGGGVVYRCYQKSLGRSVAIKVLASDLDEDDRERFLREGYAMGALSGHPNIVNILQVGVTESHRPFIVMPYHAAGSLAQRVHREGRIAWPEALRIGVKLCGALETAHRTGTLHRDIKPANVLFNDYGEPQLSDFGTARIAGGYKTVTGFFTGTLSYTAPEVLSGNPPTVAADVYSLGASILRADRRESAARAQDRRGSDRALSADHFDARAGPAACGNPQRRMRCDREGDVAGAGGPTGVGGGIRPRIAVGAAAQRVDSGSDGAQRARRPPRADGRHTSVAVVGAFGSARSTWRGFRFRLAGGHPPSGSQRHAPPTPDMFAHTASVSQSSLPWQVPPVRKACSPDPAPTVPPPKRNRKRDPDRIRCRCGGAAVGDRRCLHRHVIARHRRWRSPRPPSRPTAEAQPDWRPIADARVARDAVAATEADGTIWVFGGMGADNRVSGATRGLRPCHRQLEERRRPTRSRAACDGGDVAGHPGRARRLAHRRHQSEGCNGPGVAGCQQSLDGAAASVAAQGGSGGRRGGRSHHRHRRCGLRRQAAEHHRDLRRHLLEARRPHPHSTTDVGRGVRRQAGVRPRRDERDLRPGDGRGVRPGGGHVDEPARTSGTT